MTALVFVQNGQAFTTTEIVAQGVEIENRALVQTLRKYQSDFETFGTVAFQTRGSNGKADYSVFALLNEQQATLLVTYCKNTEIVRKFKVALVKAFYEARQAQLSAPTSNTITNAQQVAIQQAVARRAKKTAAHYQTIYRAIKARYQIPRYTELPKEMYEDCVQFIETVDLHVPEVPEQKPEPAKVEPPKEEETYTVRRDFLERQMNFVYMVRYLCREPLLKAVKIMQALDVQDASALLELCDGLYSAMLEENLRKLGFDVKEMDSYKYWASTRKHA